MLLYQIVVLALVQGITEFLPVSSSAHLVIMPRLLGLPDQGLDMDIAAHLGTLLAVLVYFRKDVWSVFEGGLFLLMGRKSAGGAMALNLAVATVPVMATGYFVYDHFESLVRNIDLLIIVNAAFALVMWLSERVAPKHKEKQAAGMALWEAFAIGLAQALAVVPGVSRSGVTMSAGRALGFTHDQAARFSLLLSIPTILAAVALSFWGMIHASGAMPPVKDFIIVTVLAFFSALAVIDFMMHWFRRAGFGIFVAYRLLLSAGLWIYFGYFV